MLHADRGLCFASTVYIHTCRSCCMQTVVLDYIQSEIQLKSSRDKSQLELAGKHEHRPYAAIAAVLVTSVLLKA